MQIENIVPVQETVREWLRKPRHQLLIGGQWVDPVAGGTLATINPATGEVLAQIAAADAADVDRAVAAARTAFDDGAWRSMTPALRARLLWRIADLIDAHIEELSELETLDQGKALYVGRWAEIPMAAEQFRFFAGLCTKVTGDTIPSSINYQPVGKRVAAFTTKEPVGVVAAITPWNSPLIMHAMKLAPALAAGCTVVLKPAEETSLTALRLAELLVEAGVPAGVVNVVTGLGPVVGAALAAHKDVDKVAFTGSTQTGRAILDGARGNLKKVTLELGGKSPVVIMPDADLDAAIPGAANAIFFNGGQVCVAGSRLYAHRSIFDKVVAGVAAIARSTRLGHGLSPDTQMGPLVSKRQADRVKAYIDQAVADGATLVTGGGQKGPAGTFIEPTVITNADPASRIMCEEVFGPVVVATPFDDVAEVVAAANDTEFGLAASVWTQDLSAAHRLSSDIRAGTVWVNCHSFWDVALPIGGFKQSGWGRESGAGAIEKYLEIKTVCMVL
ncbi:betaine-aldehyde dehydrogenase [Niveispirillum lacus]|uniref:Betaine-aldehyde dehydrogenase n=1 Tax=Niveispirillum lacus TaxID=1981099 RepID=A0A255YR19_9PROT|nr:aldehyde dehydrogenase family protein [Niveispirillum lacus]OYQ31653.1 betaine-aldehyde dehydrogenase [Niveispirillum lacus]